ncbi:MAG: hypothetical protein ACD_79C00228G0002 [uncultured bacterium]|nr:MAG: hypothetical protein ACD_79C00228G0002 [uncultured bacterium]
MKTFINIQNKLRAHKSEIEQKFHISAISIFGSYVRGEEKTESDIDVLVSFSEPVSLFKFLDLEEYLTDLLGIKVDLVSKKALKPHIGERILKEAVAV